MTGGRVVILGKTGRNFAAGMSGGIAYIWDEDNGFCPNCNLQLVALEKLEEAEEIAEVRQMIQRHLDYTKSKRAAEILANWDASVKRFLKVIPKDYKRVLQSMKKVQQLGLTGDEAVMAAFEENVRDAARVGGG